MYARFFGHSDVSRDRNPIFVMQFYSDLNDILNIIKCVFETFFVLEKFSVKT